MNEIMNGILFAAVLAVLLTNSFLLGANWQKNRLEKEAKIKSAEDAKKAEAEREALVASEAYQEAKRKQEKAIRDLENLSKYNG